MNQTQRKRKAYNRAYHIAHREKHNARSKAYYRAHPEEEKARQRSYNKTHRRYQRAYAKAYRLAHLKERNAYNKTYRAEVRWTVLQILAQTHGDDEPRCQIRLTPNTPVSHIICEPDWNLEIDHMNGGGAQEKKRGARLQDAIVDGERILEDLRLLCLVHQQWNRIVVLP